MWTCRVEVVAAAVLVASALGCGPPLIERRLPVGWVHPIPDCAWPIEYPENDILVEEGPQGTFKARAPGDVTIRCADSKRLRVRVRQLASLSIEGATRVVLNHGSGHEDYWIKAVDTDGKELDVLRYDKDIEWAASGTARITTNTCGHSVLDDVGCDVPNMARVYINGPQTIRVEARLLGRTISLAVEAMEPVGVE